MRAGAELLPPPSAAAAKVRASAGALRELRELMQPFNAAAAESSAASSAAAPTLNALIIGSTRASAAESRIGAAAECHCRSTCGLTVEG